MRVQITASHWQLLSPLVDEALALAPEARSAWLDAQTQLSEAVHVQLAELIAVADAPETNALLRTLPNLATAPQSASINRAARAPGNIIGAYTLLRPLGRGGMAEVWLARRNDGAYERDIALKLPLAHLPANHAAERLLRERNVLATLEHPAIARLYDAGIAADGQPFLAMEYVEGENIIDYANHAKLDLRARCKLMLQVLGALHYAHQHLVVHRDLKPSNILVRADGRVALLDFGIAKVLEASDALAHATELTRSAGNALTLAYAAPEQLLGEPITTAADIYSAGVVFYELLTAQRPFRDVEFNAISLLRAMEARLPAARVTADTGPELARQHGCDSTDTWQRAVNGDLAAIGSCALRRLPRDRYVSAFAFHDDIGHFLDDQPVFARNGAFAYRARKFWQRNRVVLTVSFAATLLSAAFLTHAWQTTQALQMSGQRLGTVQALVKGLFAGMSPDNRANQQFTAKQLLDRSRAVLQADATGGDTRADTDLMMAKLYSEVGAYDDATQLLQSVIAAAKRSGDDRRELVALGNLTDVYLETGRATEALALIEGARARYAAALSQDDPLNAEIEYRLGMAALHAQKFELAGQALTRARNWLSNHGDKPDDLLVLLLQQQAALARRRGDTQGSLKLLSEAVQHLPQDDSGQLKHFALANELLATQTTAGFYETAIKGAHALQAQFAGRLADDSDMALATSLRLARALVRAGRLNEASDETERLLSRSLSHSGSYRKYGDMINAEIALHQGKTVVAEALLAKLLTEDEKASSALNSEREQIRRFVAHGLMQSGRTQEAATLLDAALANQLKIYGSPSHPDVSLTRLLIGCAEMRQARWDAARESLGAARTALIAARGAQHYGVLIADAYLALMPLSAASGAASGAVSASALADRVERELGWQSGARLLVAMLRSGALKSPATLPPVF